tara:strand:+ start:233 stop:994 length:762 start_codon:yes stop_codon:yes gene_type:complete
MSSIYRKGRDGYYYYQTYVLNPENGKKNKRIFHSLGTKDLNEAKRKQIELDLKYETNTTRTIFDILASYKNFLFTVIITVTITLFITKISKRESSNNEIHFDTIIPKKIIQEDSLNKVITKNIKKDSSIVTKSLSTNKTNKQIQTEIPEYKILRIDKLSGAFEQGKIYCVVRNKLNGKGLLPLCKKITNEYSEFSNIIICLYKDSDVGIELALGNDKSISPEKKQDAWLAMYTFNPVEGAYFDNNPSGYLGGY